jgi:hypothetical protein
MVKGELMDRPGHGRRHVASVSSPAEMAPEAALGLAFFEPLSAGKVARKTRSVAILH